MHPLVEAMADMKEKGALQIVDDLLAQGEDPKVINGGGQMDDTARKYAGADAYGDNAMEAMAFANKTAGGA